MKDMEDSRAIISSNVLQKLLNLYSDVSEERLLQVLSTSPSLTVIRVNTQHPHAQHAHNTLQQHLQQHHHHEPVVDDDVSNHLKNQYKVARHEHLNDLLIVSSLAASPPLDDSMDLQPQEKEVIVDTSCGSAVLRGADIFAAGVLAAHPCMQKGDIVSVYADLEHKCRRGLAKKFTEGKRYFLGNGIALYSRSVLFENNAKVSGTAVRMLSCGNGVRHPSLAHLDSGLFFPQNLPSSLVSHVMSPRSTDTVLDMCASPGGKTTHIACLIANDTLHGAAVDGIVIAIDKTEKKVNRIRANCDKLGLTNVNVFAHDSTKLLLLAECVQKENAVNAPCIAPPFPPHSFDRILVDPPCSGLGQRPQLRYVMSDKELNSYPVYQKKLLRQAVPLLKPGGCLVYSTCTLLPEENESQVAWLLKTFPQLQLDTQIPHLGRNGFSGYGLSDDDCEKVQRFDWSFFPATEEYLRDGDEACRDTIGFFIAKFVKGVDVT